MKLKPLVALIVLALPWRLRLFLLRRMGHQLDDSARIGFSIVICEHINMGENARIGHFNVIRDLTYIELEDHSHIGNWNWITSAKEFRQTGRSGAGSLRMAESSAITSRHYIDCSGGVSIGHHSLIAGVRSTVLTHQIDVNINRQTIAAVTIGSYCLISSGVSVVPGTSIADNSLVAMGSVARGEILPSGFLWAGVPCARKGPVSGEWFRRETERTEVGIATSPGDQDVSND